MWAALDKTRQAKARDDCSLLQQTLDEIESFRAGIPPQSEAEDADLVVHRASLDGEAACAEYRAIDTVLIDVGVFLRCFFWTWKVGIDTGVTCARWNGVDWNTCLPFYDLLNFFEKGFLFHVKAIFFHARNIARMWASNAFPHSLNALLAKHSSICMS